MHARPTAVRVPDYHGETLSKAFPLLFPYGHSGMKDDPALPLLAKKLNMPNGEKVVQRSHEQVLKKYLRHRLPAFHTALFNLVVYNMLMKQKIFESVRIHANYENQSGLSNSERFAGMTTEKLERAINAARTNHPSQFGAATENQFLRSVSATCRSLPHTNEASQQARKIYFSFLMHFGHPGVFLTVTPDDEGNFHIVLYAIPESAMATLPDVDISHFNSDQIILEFKTRKYCRTAFPGFCAEEYQKMMTLIIKHIFQWDEEKQCSTGQGCFSHLDAWCLATEEQGRKTLHGHFLLFIRNWKELMSDVQKVHTCPQSQKEARSEMTKFSASICRSELMDRNDVSKTDLFHHPCTSVSRKRSRQQFCCDEVPPQILRDMRHKKKCKLHNGHIATCRKCDRKIMMNDIVENAIKGHFHHSSKDLALQNLQELGWKQFLNHLSYTSQRVKKVHALSDAEIAFRYFVNNAVVNIHCPTHARRCFKKGEECYANLPELPCLKNKLHFKEQPDTWYDYKGLHDLRWMFRYYPRRKIEDVFMNVHSPLLTKLYAYNTNVLTAMNGPVVFYVTGYQAKQQQKEERYAYTRVSEVICKVLKNFAEDPNPNISPNTQGFRYLLAAIYAHTNCHIVAAPMAHFLSLHESRFRFSHDYTFVPTIAMESFLLEKPTVGTVRRINGATVWHHSAMDYVHRPERLEDISFLNFYKLYKFMSIREARSICIEHFEYSSGHSLKQSHCIVKRERLCVATFPWNWLCSTSNFEKPLMEEVPTHHKDYISREEYCLRFLILFKPFRNLSCLLSSHSSFQSSFVSFVKSGQMSKSDEDVANNIQDIHNSIRVEMPQNLMNKTTFSEGEESEQIDEYDCEFEDLHFGINQTHILTGNFEQELPVDEAECEIYCRYLNETDNIPTTLFSGDQFAQNCVRNVVASVDDNQDFSRKRTTTPENRFQTTWFALHSLFSRSQEILQQNINENTTQTAVGTAASIIQWGRIDVLDKNQQIAFEILAATYVLTFCEDASEIPNIVCVDEEKQLKQLTRCKTGNLDKLRMFLTGPAGAGKCKLNCTKHVCT